jgi:type II secretory pathway component GspD/PulD (secretin)
MKRRMPVRGALTLALLLAGQTLLAQVPPREPTAPETRRHRLEMTDESFRDALQRFVADHGMQLIVIGAAGEAVTLIAEGATFDDVIRAAAARAGYLASRDGKVWTLYGTGAERELAGQDVLYTHTLQAMTAERAVEQLSKLGMAGVHVSAVRELNGVFIRGSLTAVRDTVRMLDSVDLEAATVYVELLVVEYSHGKRFEWRFDVTNATFGRVSNGGYRPGAGIISGTYNFVTQMKTPFKFNLVALVTDNLARIITNPHIAVQNGSQAKISFTQEEHIVLTPPPIANLVATSTFQVITAPIELIITPIATGDGTIHLDVAGQVAFFVGAAEGQYSIDRHTIQSRVAIRDGETLILGGLIKETKSTVEAGVPFLRRLPLLGHLFQEQDTADRYTETVIYVTPRLNDGRSFDETTEESAIDEKLEELEERQRKRSRRW